MHLIREGQFAAASTFREEAGPIDIPPHLTTEFVEMYEILNAMRIHRNLGPAIAWARSKSTELDHRGSNLEFDLCRLQFVWLFLEQDGQMRAFHYARKELKQFQEKHLDEIEKLLGAFAFQTRLKSSPYAPLFADPEKCFNDVANAFTKEFCSLLGLSAESPLYIAATAGAIALPTLMKMAAIMKDKKTGWSTVNELPVRLPFFPPAVCSPHY